MNEKNEVAEECIRTLETLAGDHEPVAALPVPKPDTPRTQIRQNKRYVVRWRVAVVSENGKGKNTFYGRVNDISMGGISILCEQNIFTGDEVSLFLAMPPLNSCDKQIILKIRSQMIHAVLAGGMFRVGLKFISFKSGDRNLLEMRLTHHHHAVGNVDASSHSKTYLNC